MRLIDAPRICMCVTYIWHALIYPLHSDGRNDLWIYMYIYNYYTVKDSLSLARG